MFETLSLLVPIRGHAERRAHFWASLHRTIAVHAQVQLVVRVDDDDEDTHTWALGLRQPTPTIVVGPRYDGYRSLPRFFNEMAQAATGDLLMCGNDDMAFMTEDWAGDLLAAANQYPDGLFNLGTYTYPAGSFPFSCVSRAAVEALGFLNDERLVYSDIFLRDVMARFGRAVLLPQIVIMHVGQADDDAVAVKGAVHRDADAYWRLHEACVEDAVATLRQRRAA